MYTYLGENVEHSENSKIFLRVLLIRVAKVVDSWQQY